MHTHLERKMEIVKKSVLASEDHNHFAKVAKDTVKQAFSKSRDPYHAKKEAQIAVEEAGAAPDVAMHHAQMAATSMGCGSY